MEIILILYLLTINLIGFISMAVDKKRARKHQWRIAEKVFFLLAFFGGSIGTWAGMYAFHHKTKHWYFVIGMPMILVIQILAVIGVKYYFL